MKNNLPLAQCTKRDSNYKWVEKKILKQASDCYYKLVTKKLSTMF